MTKLSVLKTKKLDSDAVRDLGDATKETKGYNFDTVQEIQPLDKKYDF